MSDLRQQLGRSLAVTGNHLRVVQSPTLAEVEAEIETIWAELEPLMRAHDALLKVRERLYKETAA